MAQLGTSQAPVGDGSALRPMKQTYNAAGTEHVCQVPAEPVQQKGTFAWLVACIS